MAETVTIRPGGPEDWEAIARLHAASWRSAYRGIYPDDYLDGEAMEERRTYWREATASFKAGEDALFVAEQTGRPVGFACVRRTADSAGPLLDNLHVLPDRKGEGIGRALITRATAWLVEQDRDAPLQLLVWKANAPARRFYAGLGGVEVEEVEAPLAGGGTGVEMRVRWERAAELAKAAR